MRLKFWGTRGSIPAPIRPDEIERKILGILQEANRRNLDITDPKAIQDFSAELSRNLSGSTIGGNTTCVTIELENELLIFDAGSGIRELGDFLMNDKHDLARKYKFNRGEGHAHIFFTHTHWDHIQGFPFFKPIHVPGNAFDIYHIHDHVPDTLARQMQSQFFPLPFDQINAAFTFHKIEEGGQVTLENATITNIELKHPGRAYAYRVVADNAIAILATDGEYKSLDYASTAKYCNFYANADVLIFDSMFSVRESFFKEDWGHSSALIGADIAREANVKRLYLFHHDPVATDAEIMQIMEETREYLGHNRGMVPEVMIAKEGLEVDLSNPIFMSDFYMKDRQEAGVVLMDLSGRFGAHAIEQFRKQLTHSLQVHQSDKVILQLENLSDMTMAGIRALVDARRSVDSLALVSIPTNVYRVLELAGTTDFFSIYNSAEEAMQAMNNHNHNDVKPQ